MNQVTAITREVMEDLKAAGRRKHRYSMSSLAKLVGTSVPNMYEWDNRSRTSRPVVPIGHYAERVSQILTEEEGHRASVSRTLRTNANTSSMVIDQSILDRLTEKVTIVGKVKVSLDVNGTPAHVISEDETYNEGDTVLIKNEDGEHKTVKLQPTVTLIPVG